MAEITDSKSLQAWLKTRPPEDAVLIAARAALRVLPLVGSNLARNSERRRAEIVLPTFRAMAVASFAGKWPRLVTEVRAAADAAARPLSDAASTAAIGGDPKVVIAALGAAFTAQAAAGSADTFDIAARTADYAAQTARRAEGGFFSDDFSDDFAKGDHTVIWRSVASDATALEGGSTLEALGTSPIWQVAYDGMSVTFQRDAVTHTPLWATEAWSAQKQHLLAANEDWQVWTDWYDAILEGRPLDPDLELKKALIPDDVWRQGPAVVNAEIARLIAEHGDGPTDSEMGLTPDDGLIFPDDSDDPDERLDPEAITHALAQADFGYDTEADAMVMVPFLEDLPGLNEPERLQVLAARLGELRDACLDLADDIEFDQKQVPGGLRRDLSRYAREAALGPADARPGRLRWLGDSLVGARQDDDIRHGLGDYLLPKLDGIVRLHLRLQTTFHAGMLERMRPLEDARLEATPEQAETEVRDAIEQMRSEAWRDLPRIPEELPEIVDQQLEHLRDMATAIDLKPEGEERRRLIRQREEGYITIVATAGRLVVRTLEWANENKAVGGAATLVTILGGLMALIGLF